MVVREPRTSDEEFETLIHLPENADKWFEMLRGVIYEVVMPTPLHATIALVIAAFLRLFVTEHQLGNVVGDGCLFYLPNGDRFIPDAAFVSKERQAGIPAKYEIAPDLAVEVVSPGNTTREILNKVESYIACGTRLVWVAYPDEKVVDVWRPGQNGRIELETLGLDGVLDGENVLPGFQLPVKNIFPA